MNTLAEKYPKATDYKAALERYKTCKDCKKDNDGEQRTSECDRCHKVLRTEHQYPMILMIMQLPAFALHVYAHEAIFQKRFCHDCSSEFAEETVAAILSHETESKS